VLLSIHVVVTATRRLIGIACDGAASATLAPCPRHHDEHNGQDTGTGQEHGQTRQIKDKKSVPSTYPTGETPTVFHGYSGSAKTAAQTALSGLVM
jgi:hypothetical protein